MVRLWSPPHPHPPCPIEEKKLGLGSSKPCSLSLLLSPFPHTKSIPETPQDKKMVTWKQEMGHCAPCGRWDLG